MPTGYLHNPYHAATLCPMVTWVLICRVIELIGYSDDAVRAKMRKGVWLEGVHWRRAPDGRIVFDLEAIQRWIEGRESERVAVPVFKSTSRTGGNDAGKH